MAKIKRSSARSKPRRLAPSRKHLQIAVLALLAAAAGGALGWHVFQPEKLLVCQQAPFGVVCVPMAPAELQAAIGGAK